jgi:amino acid adenylation domain-containing protein
MVPVPRMKELMDRVAGLSPEKRRLLEHRLAKARPAVDGPGTDASTIPAMTPAERERVLVEWNRTAAPFPPLCMHQFFEAQARRTPNAVALVFGGGAIAYAELDARANRLARRLRALGVTVETPVAVSVERGFDQIVAILGVLKAGGAYVPVDPVAPAERRSMLLADAKPAALVCEAALADVAPDGLAVIRVDLDRAAIDGESAEPVENVAAPENLAYVLYTSGSTGKPKGVLGHHRGIVNLVTYQIAFFGAGPGERILQFAPLHFDAATAEIFTALGSGAALVLGTREQLMPGRELVALMRDARVTSAKFTPSALAATPYAELPELRTVITGGEAATAELVERWGRGRRFINVYGPTETSVRGAMGDVQPDGRRPSIGRAFNNMRLYVLDERGLPVPVGAEGELYIGGVGVARGYLGRFGLTAERFVPDAWAGEPGARMYRTGDRARWREDGTLDYLGRLDDQVKVRGVRTEPGEVEAVLRTLPGVAGAAVAARKIGGETALVAYVVPQPGGVKTPALRQALAERLPEAMVPAAFVLLEALPFTSSGKLDRRSLPDPEPAGGTRWNLLADDVEAAETTGSAGSIGIAESIGSTESAGSAEFSGSIGSAGSAEISGSIGLAGSTESAGSIGIAESIGSTDSTASIGIAASMEAIASAEFEAVHEAFARRAARHPAAVAVERSGKRTTYGEIEAKSNRIAHRLRKLGVEPGGRVAVALKPSAEMAMAIFAVLKAGAACLPIDVSQPADQVARAIEVGRADVLVSVSKLAASLPIDTTVLSLDADAEVIERDPPSSIEGSADPDGIALLSDRSQDGREAALTHRALAARTRGAEDGPALLRALAAWAAGGGVVLADGAAPRFVLPESAAKAPPSPDADELATLRRVLAELERMGDDEARALLEAERAA